MLRFFRENAVVVCWSIVIFFAATMFTGGLFFGFGSSGADRSRQPVQESNFVSLGQYAVSPQVYSQVIQLTLAQYRDQGLQLSPVQMESLKYRAMNTAIEQEAFFIAAQEREVQVASVERKALEKEFLLENKIKNRSALKRRLKENGVPYKAFKASLDRELMIRTLKSQLAAEVLVTDYVVANSFKSYKFDTVVVASDVQTPDSLMTVSTQLKEQLNKGESVSTLQTSFEQVVSVSVVQAADFRDYLQLDSRLRAAFSAADIGVYLHPICETGVCLVPRLVDIKESSKPSDYDEAAYVEQLKLRLQQDVLSQVFNQVLDAHPLVVHAPDLQAIRRKSQGDFLGALEAYQTLSTSFPSSPVPHFFRATLLNSMGQTQDAVAEFQKASIKAELDDANAFPELFIEYADVLMKEKKRKAALEQYKEALRLSDGNERLLELMQQRFKEHSFKKQEKEAKIMLASLKARIEAEKEAKEAAANDDVVDNGVKPVSEAN